MSDKGKGMKEFCLPQTTEPTFLTRNKKLPYMENTFKEPSNEYFDSRGISVIFQML